ncbi:response regulator [Gemmatimonas aurantiaca]|nr:response regulator [Gemmatimonas aurantiaca]
MRSGITILVVDDEETLQSLLQKLFERDGYRTFCAGSVAEAKEALCENKVDVIVSDIKMPGGSGYDLLQYVRKSHPNIGVILMTGYGDLYSVRDAMLHGADEYVTKPFKGAEMCLLVDRVYWRKRTEMEAAETEAAETEATKAEN